MGERAVKQVRNVVILLAAALVVAAAVSLYANLRQLDTQYEELARWVGSTTSQTIAAMRDWNMRFQGVYVPKSAGLTSNPYLDDPLRDLTTTQGLELTKINHAQMTRLISELLSDERGVHVHLTSEHPLRPQNAADAWEKSVLHRFAANPGEARETTEVHKDASGKEIFRYMAPLKADAYCLTCHKEHQGSAEEIRGGISVWFSYEPFRRLLSQTRERIWFLHVLGLVAALVPLGMMGRKLLGSVNALQASLLRVSQLEGLVPICASCKRIRTEGSDANAQTSWVPVELYIQDRTAAEFTHGLCPECRTRLYPGMKFGSEA